MVCVSRSCSLRTDENRQNQSIFLEIRPLCESFHAITAIIAIIIIIRANHWSFQGENYPSVTCLSPGTAPKCPYYHHQGHSMWLLYNMCVCVRVRLTLWPPPTFSPQPVKGALSQAASTGTKEPEWALHRELQQPLATVWQGFPCSRRTFVCRCGAQLAYLLRPALSEATVNGLESLAAVSGAARAGVLLCVIMKVSATSVNSMTLCLGAFFPPGDERGKLS